MPILKSLRINHPPNQTNIIMKNQIKVHFIVSWIVALCALLMLAPPARAARTPQLATGNRFTVVLKSDGTLWATGENGNGQLGDGSTSGRTAPVQVGTDDDWVAVAGGDFHMVAVKSNGTLWAWGNNNYGQLGDNTTTERHAPVQIGTAANWVAVAAGSYHTMALRADGTLWGWGNNYFGQLGDNTTTDRHAPVQIGTGSTWHALAAGDYSTLGIKTDGTLWTWGDNSTGELGDGSTTNRHAPVQIGSDTTWVAAAGGDYHTLAVKADGSLWAWGDNSSGQLGDGTTTNHTSPVRIGTDTDWNTVAAGTSHSHAGKANGTCWGWGQNTSGAVGDGSTTDRHAPTQIGTGQTWLKVAAGAAHAAAIMSDGRLWAWGINSQGQVGDGSTTERHSPVQFGMDNKVVAVVAGSNHGVARKSDGTLWTWGLNSDGELGDGTVGAAYDRNSPARIGTNSNWTVVGSGSYHSFGIQADGTLWAWGRNNFGQLGDNTTINRLTPVQVGTTGNWAAITGGYEFSIGLQSNGTLWAWGNNNYGQLGNGSTSSLPYPVRVGTDTKWVKVAAGYWHCLALKADGSLWAWGNNFGGQLGDGTKTNRSAPVQIGAGSKWIAVACGDQHSLAVRSDGTLWAWGDNSNGKLGDGTTILSTSPVQVGTGNDWTAVGGGMDHSLGLRSDGSLWAWGANDYNQVGDGTATERHSPVQVGTGMSWVFADGGSDFSLALAADGTLWGWGEGAYGKLGLGDFSGKSSPTTQATSPIATYTVTPSAGTHGTIAPIWQVMVNYNSTTSFTVTPEAGYRAESVTGGGGTLTGNTYTTTAITADRTVAASFALGQIVQTTAITNVTTTAAASGGSVTNQGSLPVTARGVCWNTTGSPTVADSLTTNGSGTGSFTSSLTGLTPGYTYCARAYATTAAGTAYGGEVSFTTTMSTPGNCLAFNGTGQYVNLADANTLDMTSNYTLETWFKADSFGGLRGLIDKYQTANANGWLLRLTGTDLDFDQLTTTGLNLQSGQWYHVAAVNNGGTRHLYVNGVEKTISGTATIVAANTNEVRLGCDYRSRYFAGQLDEVRIWNVVRTQTDIQDAMHRVLAGSETGLVAYYQFDRAAGSVLPDLTTNAITGTLVNGPVWTASSFPCANAIAARTNLRGVWVAQTSGLASNRLTLANATVGGTDFALVGHDNGTDDWQNADVPPGTTLGKRLTRVWQAETRGSASGAVRIDTTGLSDIGDGSGLRLLRDADGTFASGAAVLSGTYSAPTFTVSGESVSAGAFYTLAVVIAAVNTASVHDITQTTAIGGGEVTSGGGQPVTARGICWNTAGSPTLADTHTTDGSGLGTFTSTLTGLTPRQSYHVRAYATTAAGTVFGGDQVITALMTPPGNALAFNSSNGYVNVSYSASLDLATSYTLECWFKANSFGAAGVRRALISRYQNEDATGYRLRLSGSDIDFDEAITTNLNLQSGRWYHVAAVKAADGTRHLYVNGVEQALSGEPAATGISDVSVRLGRETGGQSFNGQLDEVRVWSKARSENEIRDAMHHELSGNEANLALYFQCNQTSGGSVSDLSPNGNNGLLQNDVTWAVSTFPCAYLIADRTNLRGVWSAQTTSLASSLAGGGDATPSGTNSWVLGHDGGALTANTGDKPPALVWRLNRVWRGESSGSVSGTIRFDCTGIAGLIADPSQLRLLTDSDGVFANATEVAGAYAGGVFSVSGQTLPSGAYFTLGEHQANQVIIADAGTHGTMTPSGAVGVTPGGSVHFTITPDPYYHVADVTKNSVSLGAITDYTWTNVTADGTIHATFAPDLAANGTPHWWLAQYGWTTNFDAAEAADTDGDGQSAAQEYLADTDPTASSSVFRVTEFISSPSVAVTCNSSANRLYTLYRNTGLAAGDWLPVSGQTDVPGTGSPLTLHDTTTPQQPHCFYRIGARPPSP